MVFGSSSIVNMRANKRLRIHHMVMVFALACLSVLYPMISMAQNKPSSKILILGDSLSAEYGLARGTGWVALLEKRLNQQYPQWRVMNASISGETTAGGQTRLAPLLKSQQPQIVVIELGANDALRGLQLPNTEKNLKQMIQQSQASGAQVLLVGMRIPPNYGIEYTQRFFNTYGKLAESEKVAHVPFFLDKVAEKIELFQSDRIHPNEKAQSIMLENVWVKLKPMLE
jgi:acyl-CoA thioesterase-1